MVAIFPSQIKDWAIRILWKMNMDYWLNTKGQWKQSHLTLTFEEKSVKRVEMIGFDGDYCTAVLTGTTANSFMEERHHHVCQREPI